MSPYKLLRSDLKSFICQFSLLCSHVHKSNKVYSVEWTYLALQPSSPHLAVSSDFLFHLFFLFDILCYIIYTQFWSIRFFWFWFLNPLLFLFIALLILQNNIPSVIKQSGVWGGQSVRIPYPNLGVRETYHSINNTYENWQC